MFEFTTLSVYNEIITEGKGTNLRVSANGKIPAIRIGNTRFNANQILSIEIKNPSVESLAKVEFDLQDVIDKIPQGLTKITGRIVLYIGLSMNLLDTFYANDFVYKGKPFFVEFPVTANTKAKDVKKIIDKYLLFMTDEKILTVTPGTGNNDKKIAIEGVNGYQLIKKAVLLWYNPEAKTVDCCTNQGDYEDIIIGVPVVYTIDDTTGLAKAGDPEQKIDETGEAVSLGDNEVGILPGLEAFGDYNWMIHNLRLPTLANTYFWSPTKNEMPVPGTVYTQFVITMRDENKGTAGNDIGQVTTCQTNHVLYVAGKYDSTGDSPAKTVYTALNTLASNKIETTADDRLVEPFE